MPEVLFKNISENERLGLRRVFDYIAKSKIEGAFSETELASVLGDKTTTYFINPTREEADEILKRWRINPNSELKWDFGSWFDALDSAEISYESLVLNSDGTGRLIYDQLAWPSGGIDATEELIKAFGGEVVSNDAI